MLSRYPCARAIRCAHAQIVEVYERTRVQGHSFGEAPVTTVLEPSSRMDASLSADSRQCETSAPFAPKRVALLLGVFFLSLFALTMSGHFTSPDEEIMYQVSRSMAELHG